MPSGSNVRDDGFLGSSGGSFRVIFLPKAPFSFYFSLATSKGTFFVTFGEIKESGRFLGLLGLM